MSKYEKTMAFYAGSWYSEKDVELMPDEIFEDYTYFKYDQKNISAPWECKKDITIKITAEIL